MSPLYLITYDYHARAIGRVTGTADISLNKQSRREITEEISEGYIRGVERVYECVPGESCTDITEDVARAVRDRIVNEQLEKDYGTVTWLHQVLGVQSIQLSASREDTEADMRREMDETMTA